MIRHVVSHNIGHHVLLYISYNVGSVTKVMIFSTPRLISPRFFTLFNASAILLSTLKTTFDSPGNTLAFRFISK